MQSAFTDKTVKNNAVIQIRELYGTVGKKVETIQKYANILIGSSDEDLAIAGDIYGNLDAEVNTVKELLMELQTISELRRNNDLGGAKLYMGTDAQTVLESRIQIANGSNWVVSIICILSTIISIFIIYREVLKPIKVTSYRMQQIALNVSEGKGDLTERFKIIRQDEVGQLMGSMNQLLEAFQKVTLRIQRTTVCMEEAANRTEVQFAASNDKITDLSAVMEELSTGSEEVSTLVSQMETEMQGISGETSDIAAEVNQGTNFAAGLKERAGYIRMQTAESRRKSESMVESIKGAMTSSIEAARAGESGKGFAVVAEEIRNLADNSKTNAAAIQELNNKIITVVQSLSMSGEKILDFVDADVMEDYKNFETMSVQYANDADIVSDIMELKQVSEGFIVE